jgi:hypothetical protein
MLSGCKGCVTLPCGHCFHMLCARKSERHAIIEKVPRRIDASFILNSRHA